jgi:3-deoxy-D-manno-octulosonate 8-phosphate phosphatase (KDO 8-P phosphatase)
MPTLSSALRRRARKIKLLLMDIDGVMTDGSIYYLPETADDRLIETKGFHSRDGLGIRLAHEAGLKTGVISGRTSPVVEYRVHELGIHYAELDTLEKLGAYERIIFAAEVRDDEVCYMGDDVVDLPVLKRVGLAVGVADGHPFLRRYLHYRTRCAGGAGAVRETIELILAAQNKLDAAFKPFLR